MEAERADVVVIGAGVAGLCAARRLLHLDQPAFVTEPRDAALLPRLVVLEARERTGGRIAQEFVRGLGEVDIGASWIHGTDAANPLAELSLCLLIPQRKTLDASDPHDERPNSAFDAASRTWAPTSLLRAHSMALDAALSARLESCRGASQPISFDQLFQDASSAVRSAADLAPSDDPVAVARYVAGTDGIVSRLNGLQRFFMSAYEGAEHTDMDARMAAEDHGEMPGDHAFVRNFSTLIAHLRCGIDIRLAHVVKRVERGAHSVRVSCANGAVFEARHVIVTLPIGCLRDSTVEFVPRLPGSHELAIARIGTALFCKLFLVWDTPFWSLEDRFIYYVGKRADQCFGMLNLYALYRAPALVVWTYGRRAERMEPLGDAEAAAPFLEALVEMYGASSAALAATIRRPRAIMVTRWLSDPLARCAYSFPCLPEFNVRRPTPFAERTGWLPGAALAPHIDAADTRAQPAALLARPILGADAVPRLLFAGEATDERFYGTVHAAMLSGQRAAETVRPFLRAAPPSRL